MKKAKRYISLILVCTLLLSMQVFANIDENFSSFEMYPSYLSNSEIKNNNHIKRLAKYDRTFDTIGYKNSDGTETAYVFSNHIRYEENGKIKDKDLTVKENFSLFKNDQIFFQYSNTTNDVKTYFKNEIKNDAIKLEYQEYEICLTPITEQAKTDTKASLLKEDGQNLTNQILYPNAFGNHTKLVYTTGYSGLKEDIILDTYTGKS